MMISGVSSASASMFSNYRLSNTSSNQSTTDEASQAVGGPPPGGKPQGPPPGGKGQGPDLDTDDDDSWSMEELTAFSESLAETGATSFDAETVMDTYDTDGDGVISATERQAIEQNNGLNLPNMKDMQEVMMNGSRGLQISESSYEDIESVSLEDQTIQKMIAAYAQQSEYNSTFVNSNLIANAE